MNIDIDLSQLDPQQLDRLIEQAQREKERRKRAGMAEVRRELRQLARERGYTIEELFGIGAPPPDRGKVAPKYRNPDNPAETWSGRGRKPRWFEEALARGLSAEAMLIR